MAGDRFIAWVIKWRKRKCAECIAGMLLAFGGGCLALVATFWLVYFGIVIGTVGVSALTDLTLGKKVSLPHEWRMALSFGFVVLLFSHAWRTRGEEPEALVDEDSPWGRPWSMRSAVLSGELFVMFHPLKTASWVTYLLCLGPICLIGSWRQFLLSRYVGKLPVENLAAVLEMMFFKTSSVSREELETAFPEMPWPETARDMMLIDGVLALKSGEAKLTLSEEFRGELRTALTTSSQNG